MEGDYYGTKSSISVFVLGTFGAMVFGGKVSIHGIDNRGNSIGQWSVVSAVKGNSPRNRGVLL